MNKQELIAYLDAVCDAESAVQACEEAIYEFMERKAASSRIEASNTSVSSG